MSRSARPAFVIALLLGCGGWLALSHKRPAAAPAKAVSAATAPVAPETTPADEAPPVKRSRFGEASVYVDGVLTGVLRQPELPPAYKGKVLDLADGYKTTRYPFSTYAAALGISPKRIRGLHLYGGSRYVVIDRAELARMGDRLTFSFVQGDRGKPRVHWPGMKLNVNTTIDMLSAVAFYVDKEPPRLAENGDLVMPTGEVVAAGKLPYAPAEQGNGTRVYVDGKLTSVVKRKRLTPDLETSTGKDGVPHYSLAAYAKSLGVEGATAMDLVAGDDMIARADSAASYSFSVPPRNQGHAVIDLPQAGAPRAAKVTSIQFFVKMKPPVREVVDVDDVPSAQPGQQGQKTASND
ncbi:MAG: hypothetical protein R3B36_21775 [Polyangiaceae bacterium]